MKLEYGSERKLCLLGPELARSSSLFRLLCGMKRAHKFSPLFVVVVQNYVSATPLRALHAPVLEDRGKIHDDKAASFEITLDE
jgi:hypothetical protein